MSLIITVYTNEGIVMASDSRMTYAVTTQKEGQTVTNPGIHYLDTSYKTFLCKNRIGISACGDVVYDKKMISYYINEFDRKVLTKDTTIDEVPLLLVDFLTKAKVKMNVFFHIAGYNNNKRKVYKVHLLTKNIVPLPSSDTCGATWDGEIQVLTRLIKHAYIASPEKVLNLNNITLNKDNVEKKIDNGILISQEDITVMPELNVPWDFMSLQDGVDFATFAIKTTVDTMKFFQTYKTVGGPIDILILKPNESFWLQRKELHI